MLFWKFNKEIIKTKELLCEFVFYFQRLPCLLFSSGFANLSIIKLIHRYVLKVSIVIIPRIFRMTSVFDEKLVWQAGSSYNPLAVIALADLLCPITMTIFLRKSLCIFTRLRWKVSFHFSLKSIKHLKHELKLEFNAHVQNYFVRFYICIFLERSGIFMGANEIK